MAQLSLRWSTEGPVVLPDISVCDFESVVRSRTDVVFAVVDAAGKVVRSHCKNLTELCSSAGHSDEPIRNRLGRFG
jgi:hypothetical protein